MHARIFACFLALLITYGFCRSACALPQSNPNYSPTPSGLASGYVADLDEAQRARQGRYHIVKTVIVPRSPNLERVNVTIQDGADPRQRFIMHILRQKPRPFVPTDSIILLPGSSSNFEIYDQVSNRSSLAVALARKGFDVYGYSPRARFIRDGACDENPQSCEIMRGWGIASHIDDITFIRDWVASHSGRAPFIGGFSLGSALTFAAINKKPSGYKGAIFWDGFIYSTDGYINEINLKTCKALDAKEVPTFIPEGKLLKKALALSETQPQHQSSSDGNFTNLSFFFKMLATPDGSIVPGYRLATGDESGLKYSWIPYAAYLIKVMNDYSPSAVFRDLTCGLSGSKKWIGNLNNFTGPVLAIFEEHGFGRHGAENLSLLGSTNVSYIFHKDYSHIDSYANPDRQHVINRPIIEWLKQRQLIRSPNQTHQVLGYRLYFGSLSRSAK